MWNNSSTWNFSSSSFFSRSLLEFWRKTKWYGKHKTGANIKKTKVKLLYFSGACVHNIFNLPKEKFVKSFLGLNVYVCVCGGSLSLSTRHARDAKTNTNGCALDQLIPISTISAPNFSHDSMKYQEKILFFCEFFFSNLSGYKFSVMKFEKKYTNFAGIELLLIIITKCARDRKHGEI